MAMERDVASEHGETGLRPDSHLPEREESGGGGREGEENKEAARVRIRMDLEGLPPPFLKQEPVPCPKRRGQCSDQKRKRGKQP